MDNNLQHDFSSAWEISFDTRFSFSEDAGKNVIESFYKLKETKAEYNARCVYVQGGGLVSCAESPSPVMEKNNPKNLIVIQALFTTSTGSACRIGSCSTDVIMGTPDMGVSRTGGLAAIICAGGFEIMDMAEMGCKLAQNLQIASLGRECEKLDPSYINELNPQLRECAN